MARKSDRSRRDAAPARGRTMNVDRPTERDAPPVAKRGTSREGLYLDQVFPGVPQRIEIIEEKLGNSPGSRHSPVVPADKKQLATPERAPPPIPALTPDKPDKPASVQKPSPMEKRYAELAEPASYDAPPSPARVRLEERCWPSSQRRRRAPSPPPAPGSPASPLERASLLNAAPAVDREAAEEPLFCGFFLGARSSNDCTYFWGAPAAASSHSGCFNPFANGDGLSDEDSVS